MKIKVWVDIAPEGFGFCSGFRSEVSTCSLSPIPARYRRFGIEAEIPMEIAEVGNVVEVKEEIDK